LIEHGGDQLQLEASRKFYGSLSWVLTLKDGKLEVQYLVFCQL